MGGNFELILYLDLRGVSEPLQGYCTIVCDTCQVPLYDTERRMISNGDDRVSEVF